MEISEKSDKLHESRFAIPDIEMNQCVQSDNATSEPVKERGQKRGKSKWGPILVEKRPTRSQNDGRSMLDKAQDRKKRPKLEIPKGMVKPVNSFSVLSVEKIVDIAVDVGVCMGPDQRSRDVSASEVVLVDSDRGNSFMENYKPCHDLEKTRKLEVCDHGLGGGDAPHTAPTLVVIPQLEGCIDRKGQWILVANRKKSKPKIINERNVLEH
jgi:phosphohistidine swiveling domain-containing protein